MRYAYPYDQALQPAGGWSVTFPDVPEAITEGDTAEEVAVRKTRWSRRCRSTPTRAGRCRVRLRPTADRLPGCRRWSPPNWRCMTRCWRTACPMSCSASGLVWTRRRCGTCVTRCTAATSAGSRRRCAALAGASRSWSAKRRSASQDRGAAGGRHQLTGRNVALHKSTRIRTTGRLDCASQQRGLPRGLLFWTFPP